MEREISYSETMQGRLRAPVFRRLVVVVPSRREHRMDPRGDEGRERDVRDESASVCLGGAGRQCIEAVLPLATDEVRVDVRPPSRSAVFRYGQQVSAVERVFTRHNPLVFQVRETV